MDFVVILCTAVLLSAIWPVCLSVSIWTHSTVVTGLHIAHFLCVLVSSDYFPIQHKLVDLCNGHAPCLLRGRDWIFMFNSG